MGRPAHDLTGKRFGKLTVLRRVGEYRVGSTSSPRWQTLCDCGKTSFPTSATLKSGGARSCGCLRRGRPKHGAYAGRNNRPIPEYKAWASMIARCENPRNRTFRYHGARGITICSRWRENFAVFLEDMGPRPSPRHSLDRKDNDGNYEPANCRWATTKQQSRNRRNVLWLTIAGVTRRVPEWAELMGFSKNTIRERLRRGWSVCDAVTVPLKQ